jgi:hypothetical protein
MLASQDRDCQASFERGGSFQLQADLIDKLLRFANYLNETIAKQMKWTFTAWPTEKESMRSQKLGENSDRFADHPHRTNKRTELRGFGTSVLPLTWRKITILLPSLQWDLPASLRSLP